MSMTTRLTTGRGLTRQSALLAWASAFALATLAMTPTGVWSQPSTKEKKSIYTCTDNAGRKITSDRSIVECIDRPQRVLNADGSVRSVVPPVPTLNEQAKLEAQAAAAARLKAEQQEAYRRDRNLLHRFPNEAAHRQARESAVADIRSAMEVSRKRLEVLFQERASYESESEFYKGKPLPPDLKRKIDANDASIKAQNAAIDNQSREIDRIQRNYDEELIRLRRLWASPATPPQP